MSRPASSQSHNPADDFSSSLQPLSTDDSPIRRLHRHALESIFGFLTLSELSRMLNTSRIFAPPIVSMRAIDATIRRPFDFELARSSPLLRHVGRVAALDERRLIKLSVSQVASLSSLMPNLHVLSCETDGAGPAGQLFVLPPRLTELHLHLASRRGSSVEVDPNDVIRAAASLVRLTKLSLGLPESAGNDFSPLHSLPALRDLELNCGRDWTPAQVNQLRAMPYLHSMVNQCSAEALQHLLRPPHQLRWTRIASYIGLDPVNCGMLTTLPSLEWLTCGAMCKVDFLFSLPALRYLDLRLYGCLSEPPELAAALQSLTQLTDLQLLGAQLNDSELTAALSVLPMLESLSLTDLTRVLTLAPLTCGSLPRTLTSLSLRSFSRQSQDVIPHLLQLRSLAHLHMKKMIIDFNEHMVQPLRAPSDHLPKLLSSTISA